MEIQVNKKHSKFFAELKPFFPPTVLELTSDNPKTEQPSPSQSKHASKQARNMGPVFTRFANVASEMQQHTSHAGAAIGLVYWHRIVEALPSEGPTRFVRSVLWNPPPVAADGVRYGLSRLMIGMPIGAAAGVAVAWSWPLLALAAAAHIARP